MREALALGTIFKGAPEKCCHQDRYLRQYLKKKITVNYCGGASKMPEPTPGIYTALLGEVVLSHFTDEETEAQREGVTCPGSTDKRQS